MTRSVIERVHMRVLGLGRSEHAHQFVTGGLVLVAITSGRSEAPGFHLTDGLEQLRLPATRISAAADPAVDCCDLRLPRENLLQQKTVDSRVAVFAGVSQHRQAVVQVPCLTDRRQHGP